MYSAYAILYKLSAIFSDDTTEFATVCLVCFLYKIKHSSYKIIALIFE